MNRYTKFEIRDRIGLFDNKENIYYGTDEYINVIDIIGRNVSYCQIQSCAIDIIIDLMDGIKKIKDDLKYKDLELKHYKDIVLLNGKES